MYVGDRLLWMSGSVATARDGKLMLEYAGGLTPYLNFFRTWELHPPVELDLVTMPPSLQRRSAVRPCRGLNSRMEHVFDLVLKRLCGWYRKTGR